MKLRKVLLVSLIFCFIPFLNVNAKTESTVGTDDDQGSLIKNQDSINLSRANNDQSNVQTRNVYAYNDQDNDEYDDEDQNDNNTYFDARYQHYAYNTPEYRETNGRSLFIFDPNRHRWMAYNSSGELVGSGKASGGKGYCPDTKRRCKTPSGTFRVYSMGGPGCVSTKFPIGRGGAPMPYCMFFHGGFAIHGSYDVPNHNASHGCIRVEPSAARWLQENVIGIGTTVIVRPY
ncbi:MAG: L,D-transpeptidase [Gammaproteobacteria bacterium]|nr:L,D-transpeptidase [Gammaproteobacteria bacterium]